MFWLCAGRVPGRPQVPVTNLGQLALPARHQPSWGFRQDDAPRTRNQPERRVVGDKPATRYGGRGQSAIRVAIRSEREKLRRQAQGHVEREASRVGCSEVRLRQRRSGRREKLREQAGTRESGQARRHGRRRLHRQFRLLRSARDSRQRDARRLGARPEAGIHGRRRAHLVDSQAELRCLQPKVRRDEPRPHGCSVQWPRQGPRRRCH